MIFSKNSLFLLTFIFALSLQSQNSKFASENIDSLLTAYATNKKIGLPKAYLTDQIVRYYNNNNDIPSTTKYIADYKEINNALKNKDISSRYEYRNAMLNYKISKNKELDTLAYRKSYEYFKKNDSRFCADISYVMALYLDGKNAGGTPITKVNNVTRVKWYVLSGEDNFDRERYDRSAAAYCNASIIAPIEQAEALCEKALVSNNNSKTKKWTTNIYKSLMEVYKAMEAPLKLDALEQKLMKEDKNQLLKYYEWQMYENDVDMFSGGFNSSGKWHIKYDTLLAEIDPVDYKKWDVNKTIRQQKWDDNLLKEEKKKEAEKAKNQLIKEIHESTASIKLPQGSFYLDIYENNRKTNQSITIEGATITKEKINRHQDTTTVVYVVHRIYQAQENQYLLSIQKKEQDYESWAFMVMRTTEDALTINDDFYMKNSEAEQEEFMIQFIAESKLENYAAHLGPMYNEYYSKEKFETLKNLPLLEVQQYDELKNIFKSNYIPKVTTNEFWYEKFINSNGEFPHEFILEKLALKNLLIEKGYQPFSSISSFLEHENEMKPYWDKNILISKKLKELESIDNKGVLGVWIIEQPTDIFIIKLDNNSLTIWPFSYDFYKFRNILGGKDSMVYKISPTIEELNSFQTFESLDLRLDFGDALDSYKVNGEFPEEMNAYLESAAPIMKIDGSIVDMSFMLLDIDGIKHYMMSRKKYAEIRKMKKVYKLENYSELLNTLKKEVVAPVLNLEKRMKQMYIPGYGELTYKVIEELIRRGYNPFKSIPAYKQK